MYREVKYDFEERLLEYSAWIITLTNGLEGSRAGNHVAGRLLRSGTSPYSNHGEAQAAESSKDFVHKMSICLKELRESHRWLKLIKKALPVNDTKRLDQLLKESDELVRLFVTSGRTAEKHK